MSKIKKAHKRSKELCKGCTSCCEYVLIEIDAPKSKNDIDELIWFLLHGITIFIDSDDSWNLEIHNKCKVLNKKGKCSIYPIRPLVCKQYSHDECEKYKGKKYSKEKKIINTVIEFLEYIDNDPKLRKIKRVELFEKEFYKCFS